MTLKEAQLQYEIERKEKEREMRLNKKWKKSLELNDDNHGIKVNYTERIERSGRKINAEASDRKLGEQYGKMMLTEPSLDQLNSELVDYGNKKSAVLLKADESKAHDLSV